MLLRDIFAVPLNDTPAIVLAVAKAVAVAALPEVFWLPAVFTPGRFIFDVPLKETPPIVLELANFVAVAALPVQDADDPVMLEVIVPGNLASGTVPDVKLLAFKEPIIDDVTYPAPLVIALLFNAIFCVPSNDTPAIVLAVCNFVAVATFPEAVT